MRAKTRHKMKEMIRLVVRDNESSEETRKRKLSYKDK